MEIELKFLVADSDVSFLSKALDSSQYKVQQQPTLSLSNAYYDTPDNALRQWDFGLRTRCSETIDGQRSMEQTIKLSGGDIGGLQQRPEYNETLSDTSPEYVFADLALFSASIWPADFPVQDIQKKLTKIFETNFTRHVWLITTAKGAIIECVLDNGNVEVEEGGDIRQQVISEFELELHNGDVSDLIEVATYLTSKINAKLGYFSKAARGYMLAQNTELKSKNLEPCKLAKSSQLEPAFIKLLTHAIKFVQHHEVVFAQTKTLKSLRRVLDGISLIVHVLQLFSEYLPNSQCQKFIELFKQWRSEHGWIEAFYQLEQLTGRKSPYRKDIDKSEYLRSTLASIKMPDDKIEKSLSQFSSPQYNHLFLGFIQWINQKQWRSEMPLERLNLLTIPISEVSESWLDFHWLSLKEVLLVLSKQANCLDIESAFWPLTKVLLTGICVDSLFDSEDRKHFRSHLLNLMVGFEETILLQKSELILSTNAADDIDEKEAIKWLQSKQQSLQVALNASVTAINKLKPYW
jgi:triphosphatase